MASDSEHATPVPGQNETDSTVSVSDAPTSPKDDETLVDETRPLKDDMVTIDDWSQTGRGSHVEFTDEEHVPLQQGTFLGRGAAGDVHEVIVQKHKLAHKKMVVKRKLAGKEMKEIEILKRLSSHEHMIQLVGTYTHRQFLGLLVYPVAICDMATFFEDVEAWHNTASGAKDVTDRQSLLEGTQKNRLVALGYDFPSIDKSYKASPIYSKIGCLISATAYLHDQKIRHKDLKPSNILLSKGRMWLSDFGSATDFSLLSQSATDNERGTPRYFSPEVAAFQPNGRAADIFSLGCVILEILILHDQGTLQFMRENRSADPSFHANTKNIAKWLDGPGLRRWSFRRIRLVDEIRAMLDRDPARRPIAKELMIRTTGYDLSHRANSEHSIYGNCCRSHFVSTKEYNNEVSANRTRILNLQSEVANKTDEITRQRLEISQSKRDYEELGAKLYIERQQNESVQSRMEELLVEIEGRRQENQELNSSIKEEREEQRLSESGYRVEREEWEQEKRNLENRIAELETENKKEADRKFARLEELLLSQQEARIAKEKAKAQAAEDARMKAAEAKKKSDEDRLAKLEALILAQKEEQLKREAAVEAQRAADKKEANEQAAKLMVGYKTAAVEADGRAGWGVDARKAKNINSGANEEKPMVAEASSESVPEAESGQDSEEDQIYVEDASTDNDVTDDESEDDEVDAHEPSNSTQSEPSNKDSKPSSFLRDGLGSDDTWTYEFSNEKRGRVLVRPHTSNESTTSIAPRTISSQSSYASSAPNGGSRWSLEVQGVGERGSAKKKSKSTAKSKPGIFTSFVRSLGGK